MRGEVWQPLAIEIDDGQVRPHLLDPDLIMGLVDTRHLMHQVVLVLHVAESDDSRPLAEGQHRQVGHQHPVQPAGAGVGAGAGAELNAGADSGAGVDLGAGPGPGPGPGPGAEAGAGAGAESGPGAGEVQGQGQVQVR